MGVITCAMRTEGGILRGDTINELGAASAKLYGRFLMELEVIWFCRKNPSGLKMSKTRRLSDFSCLHYLWNGHVRAVYVHIIVSRNERMRRPHFLRSIVICSAHYIYSVGPMSRPHRSTANECDCENWWNDINMTLICACVYGRLRCVASGCEMPIAFSTTAGSASPCHPITANVSQTNGLSGRTMENVRRRSTGSGEKGRGRVMLNGLYRNAHAPPSGVFRIDILRNVSLEQNRSMNAI